LEEQGVLVFLYEGPETFKGTAGTCGPTLVVALNQTLANGKIRLRAAKELAHMVWEDGLREFPIKDWPSLCGKLARSLFDARWAFSRDARGAAAPCGSGGNPGAG
jgi:hypothetical protein